MTYESPYRVWSTTVVHAIVIDTFVDIIFAVIAPGTTDDAAKRRSSPGGLPRIANNCAEECTTRRATYRLLCPRCHAPRGLHGPHNLPWTEHRPVS